MIWFCSDWHFCHNKPFLYEPRGFTDIEQHDKAVVLRHNELVAPDDDVYVLGDCCLNDTERGIGLMKQMNGHKWLIVGNHDTNSRIEAFINAGIFEDYKFAERLRYKKYFFWLSHYPMMMGNFEEQRPIWNLSGHTHTQNCMELAEHNIYNVGMDAQCCKPVSIDQVIDDIKRYRRLKIKEITGWQARCDKCVYTFPMCGGTDREGKCLIYKRDPPDGGYYG